MRGLVTAKYLPSFLPSKRYARPHLPSRGSLGPPFPTFCGTLLGYDCPVPVLGRFASARAPLPWLLPRFVSLRQARWQPEAVCHRRGSWSAATPILPAFGTKETRGSPTFPSSPGDSLPCSSTPVESCGPRRGVPRIAAFRSFHSVGFPLPTADKGILAVHDYTHCGVDPTA